jgi:hypothetical protein
MNALVQLEPTALGEPEIERARRYVAAAQAATTERAYRIGWNDFCAWWVRRPISAKTYGSVLHAIIRGGLASVW